MSIEKIYVFFYTLDMMSIIFKFLYFFIFVFLSYIVPIAGFGYGAYVFFAQGQYFGSVVFLIVSVGFLAMWLLRRSALSTEKIDWLKAHGKKIMTEFKRLDRRWNIRVNGQSPIVVYSRANGRIFESEDLWFGDGNFDAFVINDSSFRAWETLQVRDPNRKYLIPVYVNPAKPREYYMDLGALEVE